MCSFVEQCVVVNGRPYCMLCHLMVRIQLDLDTDWGRAMLHEQRIAILRFLMQIRSTLLTARLNFNRAQGRASGI